VLQGSLCVGGRVLLLPQGISVLCDVIPAGINQAFEFMLALGGFVSTIQTELLELAFVTLAKLVDLLPSNRVYTSDGCLNASQVVKLEQILRRVRSLSRDRYNKQV
jgi:hypothetical protein